MLKVVTVPGSANYRLLHNTAPCKYKWNDQVQIVGKICYSGSFYYAALCKLNCLDRNYEWELWFWFSYCIYSQVSLRGGFCRSNLVFSCNWLFAGDARLLRRLENGSSQWQGASNFWLWWVDTSDWLSQWEIKRGRLKRRRPLFISTSHYLLSCVCSLFYLLYFA